MEGLWFRILGFRVFRFRGSDLEFTGLNLGLWCSVEGSIFRALRFEV